MITLGRRLGGSEVAVAEAETRADLALAYQVLGVDDAALGEAAIVMASGHRSSLGLALDVATKVLGFDELLAILRGN